MPYTRRQERISGCVFRAFDRAERQQTASGQAVLPAELGAGPLNCCDHNGEVWQSPGLLEDFLYGGQHERQTNAASRRSSQGALARQAAKLVPCQQIVLAHAADLQLSRG